MRFDLHQPKASSSDHRSLSLLGQARQGSVLTNLGETAGLALRCERALVKPILSGREHRAACFVSKLALQFRHRTAFCISPYVLANVARPHASLTLRTYNLQELTFLWSTARR